jgi:SAM-dependent methyltransferase
VEDLAPQRRGSGFAARHAAIFGGVRARGKDSSRAARFGAAAACANVAAVCDRFEFLDASADERARFPDRAAVLRLLGEPAAPANRRRSVHRVLLDGRVFYCKEFGPALWKNRLTFVATPPSAADDAEREARMAQALRRAGIDAARPVLRGRHGRGSFYLCAELPGASLRALLLRGEPPRALLGPSATFCGDLLARGFWLPDLSAEHVFARRDADGWRFGLVDLHNGRLGPPGPPPLWLCRRVLRHFAQSVIDLSLRRTNALRFATRLLRRAGRGAHARAVLRALPPFHFAARYDEPGRNRRYAERNPARGERELALLARIWPGRAGETVLDCPAGAGRLLQPLARAGHRVVWADAAAAMLREAAARAPAPPPRVLADALRLPFADRAVDGVVQFRFLHHLPPPAARIAIGEACRVARRFVVLSFFHPCSVHHLQRRLRSLLARRPQHRHAVGFRRVCRWFEAHGFEPLAHAADRAFVNDLWVAAFVRRP